METRHVFDPNHLGIQVYDLLSRPGVDDRERAKIIAEALETVQQNYPDLGNTATKRDLSETELRLIDKIEMTRGEAKKIELSLTAEIKATELRLMGEIEKTRLELKETELTLQGQIRETEMRLMGEIEKTRAEIKATELEIKDVELRLTKEIESVRTDLTKEMGKQTMKTVTYLTAIMGLFYAIVRFVPA